MTSEQETEIAQKTKTKAEATHSEVVLSSIRDLREQDIVRDFTIIVDGESFVVHRTLLAACSPYFRAMLSHDTKEKHDGVVEMKDISASAVKQCIDFMYTGNPDDVTVDAARDVIHAANLMQLDKLSDSCFEKLESSLAPENCIDIANFVEMYPCARLKMKVENYISKQFHEINSTDKFLNLSKNQFRDLVTKFPQSDEIIWKSIINWIKHDEERDLHIDELFTLLSLESFPSEILLRDFAAEPLTNTSQHRLELFYHCVFASTSTLQYNLTVGNCIIVRNWANGYKHVTKETDDIINKFLQTHFDEVLSNAEFVEVNEKDVLMLFAAEDIDNLASENLKWMSVVRWVKHNLPDRRELLPKLVKFINFAKFSNEFIQNDVRKEPLMEESPDFSKILMDSVFDLSVEAKSKEKHIAILLPESEIIRSYNLDTKRWIRITGIVSKKTLQIFSLNEKLCALTLTRIYYLGRNDKWILKTRLPENIHLLSTHKVLAFDDQIYLISKDEMLRYDLMTGEWETGLPGCDIDVEFSVIHLEKYIYAISAEGSGRYNITDQVWENLDDLSSTALSSAAYLGHIYLFVATEVKKRDATNFRHPVVYVFPTSNLELKKIISFSADNKLIAVTQSNEAQIYAYDTFCKTWTEIGQVENKNAGKQHTASACKSASGFNFGAPPRSALESQGFSFGGVYSTPRSAMAEGSTNPPAFGASSKLTLVASTDIRPSVFTACFYLS